MTTETKQKLAEANNDWDRANRECKRLLDCMRLLDIEDPLYSKMLDSLAPAQERRKAAGDRIGAIFFADAAEFDARIAKEREEATA